MQLPPRLLLPLAVLASLGFIGVGLFATTRSNTLGQLPDLREQSVSVTAEDGYPLAVRLIEPRSSEAHAPAVLVGIPTDLSRAVLAQALALRGWSVAVVDLRGTGSSRTVNGATVSLSQAAADWSRDLVGIATWLGTLPNITRQKPALIGLRAAAGTALEAKGSGETFGSLALVLPIVPPKENPVGAPAYRTTPSGVLVAQADPFVLPDAVAGYLQEPRRLSTVTEYTVAALAANAAFLDALDTWLRNPTDGG